MAVEFTSTWQGSVSDTYLDSANPSTNYESGTVSLIGYDTSSRARYHTVFELDLLSVAPSSGKQPTAADEIDCVSATLTLDVIIGAGKAGQAARATIITESAMNIAQATWTDPYSSPPYTWAGAVLSELAEPVSAFEMPTSTGTFEIDLTELVQESIATEDAHLRILLRHDSEPSVTNRVYFATKEHPSTPTPPTISMDWNLSTNAADVARGPLVNAPILRQRLIGGRLV